MTTLTNREAGIALGAFAAATAVVSVLQSRSHKATALSFAANEKRPSRAKSRSASKNKKKLSALHRRRPSASSSSSGSGSSVESDSADDSSDNDTNGDDEQGENTKKWDERKEYWSSAKCSWVRKREKPEAHGYVFIIKHRFYPSSDLDGREDYVCAELRSRHLQRIMLQVVRNAEDLYDEPPTVDLKRVFMVQDKLEKKLEELKAMLTDGKADVDLAQSQSTVASQADPVQTTPEDRKPAQDGVSDETTDLKSQIEHLELFLTFTRKHFAPTKKKLDSLVQAGQITYKLLWALMPIDSIVVADHDITSEPFAFKVKSSEYFRDREGPVLSLEGFKVTWNGTNFTKQWVECQIKKFPGVRPIASLGACPMTEKQAEMLVERGRRYKNLCRVAFMTYSGTLFQVKGAGMMREIIKLRAEGRAVVDAQSFRRIKPGQANRDVHWKEDEHGVLGEDFPMSDEGPPATNDLTEDELILLPPTVYGFSLVQRAWGEMLVNDFTEITFNPSAWDTLVLEAESKDLIKSLVQENSQSSQVSKKANNGDSENDGYVHDVIEGKGGGLVIVLHGRPGTGKTLTAEAIAELLKVPLYSVAAGELGVHADELEKRLRDILDVARSWGAVVLIDEADVFLEERQKCDISRNAMVSVFLRSLEYHSGILILTTNRIRAVDQAFLSRFSFAVTYPSLDSKKRLAIWRTFLVRAGVSIEKGGHEKKLTNGTRGEDDGIAITERYLEQLAKKRFNGRAIKNMARTAVALAKSRNEKLGTQHVDTVVKVSEQFETDFKEADESGVYDAPGEGWKDSQFIYH